MGSGGIDWTGVSLFGPPNGGMFGCGGAATGSSEYDSEPVDLGARYADTVEITSKPDAVTADTDTHTDTGLPDPCDADNDGFLLAPYCGEGPYDCNDLDPKIYPGADEVPCNGVDEDCDGKDLTDLDGDEVDGCFFSEPKDCDEKDKTIFPGAKEKTCDQIDQNCNGDADEDWDCDGYTIIDGDCNDGNSQINPGAKDKICDTDLNCDGKIDEKDVDKDGYGDCPWSNPPDCDDKNFSVHPGADEVSCNDIDENCDGKALIETDADGDGATVEGYCKPKDCDDANPLRAPGLQELCDGIDNDCDKVVDEGACGIPCEEGETIVSYSGPEGTENYGVCQPQIEECIDGEYVLTQEEILPQAEVCNNLNDDDCDDQTDEGCLPPPVCEDGETKTTYSGPPGTENVGVCQPHIDVCIDDNWVPFQEEVIPQAEACDDLDDNCDGQKDEDLTKVTYSGPPGTESLGSCQSKIEECIGGAYTTTQDEVLPQEETCNNIDDDCDGETDDNILPLITYSGDPDEIGQGICKEEILVCENGIMQAFQEEVLPQDEIPCDGIDQDCDGADFAGTDQDGDGVLLEEECGPADCDDQNKAAYPGAPELCDGKDNDCDGETDEDLTIISYSGLPETEGIGICQPKINVCIDGTLIPTQPEILPAIESCNSLDDDCDIQKDEGLTLITYSGPPGTENVGICKEEILVCENGIMQTFQEEVLPQIEVPCDGIDQDCDGADFAGTDQDGDGVLLEEECGPADCDDQNNAAYPGAPEVCDGEDNDCDGETDEDLTEINYSGPPETKGIGICQPEIKECIDGVLITTQPEVLPAIENCNNLDDNCNGQKDEGLTLITYSGPPGTENVGICKPKIQECINGAYQTIQQEIVPQAEVCNSLDENCNGQKDEGLTKTSYSGPPGTQGVGTCKSKIEECINGSYSITQQQVTPQVESCNNLDDDCDSQKDEDLTLVAYSGPPGTQNIGICKPKIQECVNGNYTTTQQEVLPQTEICNNLDDNCNNNQKDENLFLYNYSGPPGTEEIGICKPKIEQCVSGSYQTIQQQVLPQVEVCNNLDDNCNAQKDEGLTKTSYSGPPGTQDVGICKSEIKVCKNGIFVITQVEVLPQGEICNNIDDNCNIETDEPAVICSCDPDGDGIITNKFKDPKLLAAIRKALGKGPSDNITMQDALKKTSLNLSANGIKDLSGIECFTNLTELYLGSNQIQDISPVKDLINLTELYLSSNQIQDISPVKDLIKLTWLYLDSNQIQDISPVKDLINLTELYLGYNQIQDISPVKDLIKLTELYLVHNQIQDISPVKDLINLTVLSFVHNQIQDISPVKDLIKLTWLYLSSNQITDISPLSSLVSLWQLDVGWNKIMDASPLINNAGFGNGDNLCLEGNQIPAEQINALKNKGVDLCCPAWSCP